MAPHFRVVVRPNEWSKQRHRETTRAFEWSWEAYESQLHVHPERLVVGRKLVEAVEEAIAERSLPWQLQFRQGYVAFQRSGGYNVVTVDVWWKKVPRLAVKLPAPPDELDLRSPYPLLVESWDSAEREWGWTVPTVEQVPDVGLAIDLSRTFQPTSGPMKWTSEGGSA